MHYKLVEIKNDPYDDDSNLFTCPCCGEEWSKEDKSTEKVGDYYVCPACYRDALEKVRRFVNKLDDVEYEVLRKEINDEC